MSSSFICDSENELNKWIMEKINQYNWKIVNKDDFLDYFHSFPNNIPDFVLLDIYDYMYPYEFQSNDLLKQKFEEMISFPYDNIYDDNEYYEFEKKINNFQALFQQILYEYIVELYCLNPFFKESYIEEYHDYDSIEYVERYECNDKIDSFIYRNSQDILYYLHLYVQRCEEYTIIQLNRKEDIEKITSLFTKEDITIIYETYCKTEEMNRFISVVQSYIAQVNRFNHIFQRYILDTMIKKHILIYISSDNKRKYNEIHDEIFQYIYNTYQSN